MTKQQFNFGGLLHVGASYVSLAPIFYFYK